MPDDDEEQPDELDGCELDFTEEETADEDIPWIALFATIEEHRRGGLLGKVHKHFDEKELAAEWRELFDGEEVDAT